MYGVLLSGTDAVATFFLCPIECFVRHLDNLIRRTSCALVIRDANTDSDFNGISRRFFSSSPAAGSWFICGPFPVTQGKTSICDRFTK